MGHKTISFYVESGYNKIHKTIFSESSMFCEKSKRKFDNQRLRLFYIHHIHNDYIAVYTRITPILNEVLLIRIPLRDYYVKRVIVVGGDALEIHVASCI